ncbi:RNA ligase family protein [Actinomadura flavalba]|uniref:RNA ligase family protein n=1 Tax=Actinomadura flavalba TaxID=1120938 RepID=UPI000365320F|nr:RNA ligase family protein [Actinomadura flavalba]
MMHRYPRTRHLAGSRLQPGDHDLAAAPFAEIAGRHLVVEEKLDGANAGISFDAAGTLLLQSRGHYLAGGPRERQFGTFLSTARRDALLAGTPVVGVPVLHTGEVRDAAALTALVGPSTCRTPRWREALAEAAVAGGADPARTAAETDAAEEMEGLYVKVEEDGRTVGRYKWVRASFLTAIRDAGSHWHDRPIVANALADPEALYARVR